MEVIKQSRSDSCYAAVLAMIVEKDEQYVFDWFGSDPPYIDQDAAIFLADHDITFGFGIQFQTEFDDHPLINIQIDLDDFEAVIVVESEYIEDGTHVIYWKNGDIFDPSNNTKKKKLSEYSVEKIYLISRM